MFQELRQWYNDAYRRVGTLNRERYLLPELSFTLYGECVKMVIF
ncbi:MAG: hypothetical protein QXZ36_06070 [Thermoproteota archaeon]